MSKLFKFLKGTNSNLDNREAISSSRINSISLNRPSLDEVKQIVGDDKLSIWIAANKNRADNLWKCEYYVYGKGRTTYSSTMRNCESRKECYLMTILDAIRTIDKSEEVSTVELEESVFVESGNDSERIIALRRQLLEIIEKRDGLIKELVCVNVGNMKNEIFSHTMPIRWREQKDPNKKGLFDRKD